MGYALYEAGESLFAEVLGPDVHVSNLDTVRSVTDTQKGYFQGILNLLAFLFKTPSGWLSLVGVFVTCIALSMGIIPSKNKFPVDGRTVVITGGSQGMGKGLAKLLASKGANVVIVARSTDKLAKALAEISACAARPNQRFHVISADVTIPEESARILSETTAWNHGVPPEIVWANAGMSLPGLFVDTPIETLRSQMDINYWASAYLAHATLKTWLQPSAAGKATTNLPRHFIMTCSSSAFIGVAGYSTYTPAKAAMRSLADHLRSEVNIYNGARKQTAAPANVPPNDIKIHVVFPGSILSPGFEHENTIKHPLTKILEEGDPHQTEDEVAQAAVKGLMKGDYMVTTQWMGTALRSSAWGASPRNNFLVDTLCSWVTDLIFPIITWDLDRKAFDWGKKNGMGAL